MADKKIAQSVEDLVTVYKTLFLDLPLAGAKWGLGIGGEKETMGAAWKGYDASVRLATAAIDNFYQTSLFGEVMARFLRKTVTKLEEARMKSVQVKKRQENEGVNPLRAAA